MRATIVSIVYNTKQTVAHCHILCPWLAYIIIVYLIAFKKHRAVLVIIVHVDQILVERRCLEIAPSTKAHSF